MKIYFRSIPRITLVLIAVLSGFTSAAQTEPSSWSWEISDSSLVVGEQIEVVFRGVIPDRYAVYSNDYDCPGGGPLPSEFEYQADSSYALIGKANPVGAKEVYDDIFECNVTEFHAFAEFRQQIKILSPDPKISGTLDYQMCHDSGLCVLHQYEFTITGLNVLTAE